MNEKSCSELLLFGGMLKRVDIYTCCWYNNNKSIS